MNDACVRWLGDRDAADVALAGGKGAALAALGRVPGVRVPPGFCVTTDAFRRAVTGRSPFDDAVARLVGVRADDLDAIAARSAAVRAALDACEPPADVVDGITRALEAFGPGTACAVRSSATAEDLPSMSFAGLHDSFLSVRGADAVVAQMRRCWASLFTDRAVAYRAHNGIDHRAVRMAVVVQRMVPARAAGVLFTADPVSANRRVCVIEAVPGLGDAYVAGLVTADTSRVRDGIVEDRDAAPDRRDASPVLHDDEVLALEAVGRRIEAHAGAPQDIEWCIDDEGVHVVQSRAITTLFPVPECDDEGPHVYVSVGHQQMMTEPMTPFGLSLWQMTALRPMVTAGSRLFVDVVDVLASPVVRSGYLELLGRSDPLIRDALETVLARGFVPERDAPGAALPAGAMASPEIPTDPTIVEALTARVHQSVVHARDALAAVHGAERFTRIAADVRDLQVLLADPVGMQVINAGMQATWRLDECLRTWLGEEHAADVLARSAPGNITSEMGLALLDVADVVRAFPAVVTFLRAVDDDDFLVRLDAIAGGPASRRAIEGFLEIYGARCPGEIDLGRPRWVEQPSALVPVLLANVDHFTDGEAARQFARGEREAHATAVDVLARLRATPDGAARAAEVARLIERVRTFIGYRELPKYGIVSRFFVYKQALLEEIDALVAAGVLRERDDAWQLTFDELADAFARGRADLGLVHARRTALRAHASLVPPRVLTSEGEVFHGSYRRVGVPAAALVGLGVSAGVVEGRARVVRAPADARLEPGDVLVTTGTDPSWTPVFVTIAGLVTEVGGSMTHGSVIAREYGLPAVVGVHEATRRIRDGQRIRVDGTTGLVELLA